MKTTRSLRDLTVLGSGVTESVARSSRNHISSPRSKGMNPYFARPDCSCLRMGPHRPSARRPPCSLLLECVRSSTPQAGRRGLGPRHIAFGASCPSQRMDSRNRRKERRQVMRSPTRSPPISLRRLEIRAVHAEPR
jgi:hypothetical protein